MGNRSRQESITVHASPEVVYDLVSDVTRTGEWSPVCTSCSWHDAGSARVGARFTGRNERNGRIWETVSEVLAAQRGREFAWVVGDGYVRWGYTMTRIDEGTELTESWEFLPAGIAMFHEKFGEDASAQIQERTQAAYDGIPATLEAIKRIAERA